MKSCLDSKEKPKAIQLKKRCEDFINCITRSADGFSFTSDDVGIISLEYGGQYPIKNNIDNCTLEYYKKMNSNLEDILDITNSLTYTSFGIGGDVSTAKTSIRNQTTSLTDFEDSFTMYYQGIQEMESNICSKLVKISTAVNKPIMPLEGAIQDAKAMHKDNRPQYAIDIENMKNSTNLLDGSVNFLAYLWDRFPGQFALYNEQAGLNNGLTPEWAKVYGDFSSGMLIENSAAVAINGARSYKCLKTSESILQGDIFAGSGMGSTAKGISNAETKYAYNMIENPGPLAEIRGNPATNFLAGKYNVKTLDEDIILYRSGKEGGLTITGEEQNALGQWFTREPAESVAKVRIDSAVKAQWIDPRTGELTGTSPIESTYAIKMPKGTTIYEGPVGYQGGSYLGGENCNQIFVSEPWKIDGVKPLSETPIK